MSYFSPLPLFIYNGKDYAIICLSNNLEISTGT